MNYTSKFLSIIVIFYNSETTIEKCLSSILNQSEIEKVQLILIDDCSTDKSLKIVKEIVAKFSVDFILYSNQVNLGISASRQKGLELSVGEYILYIDSDDFLDDLFIEFTYNLITSNPKDIIFFDYYMNYPSKEILKSNQLIHENDIVENIVSGKVYGFLWNKIIKRSLFSEYNICFIRNIDMWEDSLIVSKLCSKTKSILYCKKAFLHYVQTNVSCVHKKMNDSIAKSMQKAIDDLRIYFYQNDLVYKAIDIRVVEYHITLFLRADYSIYSEYVKKNPVNSSMILKATQYNFFLKLIYIIFLRFPYKFNFYLMKGIYQLCTTKLKEILHRA